MFVSICLTKTILSFSSVHSYFKLQTPFFSVENQLELVFDRTAFVIGQIIVPSHMFLLAFFIHLQRPTVDNRMEVRTLAFLYRPSLQPPIQPSKSWKREEGVPNGMPQVHDLYPLDSLVLSEVYGTGLHNLQRP